MSSFDFNRQKATLLYRDWYILSKKNPKKKYDKEQIDSLRNYLLSELRELINHYSNQKLQVYRAELPILFIGEKKIETFINEILVINNSIQSINMPGCMAIGENNEDTYSNYLNAVIECSDARYRHCISFMNIIQTMKMYDANSKDIPTIDLIKELKEAGWTYEYDGVYNTVLLKKGNKVSFTIPKSEIVSSSMVLWFRKLQYQISIKLEREMYSDSSDNSHWTCDICGGDETTGCLYFDPTDCPRH